MSEIATRRADPAPAFLKALGSVPETLGDVRKAGLEKFAESGFPTRRSEAWRYTDLKALTEARFGAGSGDLAALDALISRRLPLAGEGVADAVVFVDGKLDEARSHVGALPDGAYVGSFSGWAVLQPAEAASLFDLRGGGDRAFLSLNAAFFTDGLVVIVPDGVTLDRPVTVVHWNTGASAHLKSVIRLGTQSAADISEIFAGAGSGWTNVAVTVDLGEGSRLGRYILQDEAVDSFHTAHIEATIGKGAHLDGFLLSLGARIARQDGWLTLAGDHAYCGFSGAYLLQGRQQSAIASVIEHAAPHGQTKEVFKGSVADRAHGIFQGKILVDQIAQKTDGYQLNKTILLGDRAVMDSKPELEIYADDVKCSHGATVGDLDETALFYLRSRGIPPDEARQMLIQAFVIDAIELIEYAPAQEWLTSEVTRRLAAVRS